MISRCANPACGKPLHYLREGRIYVFQTAAADAAGQRAGEMRLQHFWLCGTCMQSLVLSQDRRGEIHLVPGGPVQPYGGGFDSTAHTRLAS